MIKSTFHNSHKYEKKIKKMGDEDTEILMELDDSNLQFLPEESVELKYLVFRLINTIGDETIALANIAVMFRFDDPASMVDIISIFLGLKNNEDNSIVRLGTAIPDDDDLRVCNIADWTNSVPLPLGNNLLDRLRIIIHIDGHISPHSVKFGADLIPFPEVFLQGNPKMKRRMGNSVVRFQGGILKDVENGLSALSLQETIVGPNNNNNNTNSNHTNIVPVQNVVITSNEQLQSIINSLLKKESKEYWFDKNTTIQKPRKFMI